VKPASKSQNADCPHSNLISSIWKKFYQIRLTRLLSFARIFMASKPQIQPKDRYDPHRVRELELEIYGHTWGPNAIDTRGRPWPPSLPPPLPKGTKVTGTTAGINDWYYGYGYPIDPYADREF
jgi:hypothetical protein